MSDRELLALAAMAAGYKVYDGGKLFWIWKDSNVEWVDWNPLTDDGDALRLAVKLGIELVFTFNKIGARRHADTYYLAWANENRKVEDPYAATRRAIVRAAAEIGRNMK